MKTYSKALQKFNFQKKVFVIAEAGVNHNNDLSIAFKMIDKSIEAGADAIKFQTFKTDKMQLKSSIKPNYQKKIKQSSYYEIIKSLEPSFNDQKKIFEYCKKKGIIFLSTPYDEESVDFLDELGILAFKISSSDLTNHILLKHVSKKKKPIIMSTGLSSIKQVEESVKLLTKLKMKNKLVLLHTTSDYPAKSEDLNLRIIPQYIKKFQIPIGYSDHTNSDVASLGAVALGAKIIEKHFTLNRRLSGPDQSSSLNPLELKEWIKKIRLLESSLGSKLKKITLSENNNLTMRKILVIHPSSKGTKISLENLSAMRGKQSGILPLESNIKKILGKTLLMDINNTIEFDWKMIR